MYLKQLFTTGHKIFGAASVPAIGASYPMPLVRSTVSVELEFGQESKDNVYTYIIGNNGVGKSSYFKTIISHCYLNDGIDDPKGSAASAEYMFDMGVSVHKSVDVQDKGSFKEVYGDFRIVHFTREEGLISKHPRTGYFEFNPQSRKLSLSMLPLIYNRHNKLKLLADVMGMDPKGWSHELFLKTSYDVQSDTFYFSEVNGIGLTDLMEWVMVVDKQSEKRLRINHLLQNWLEKHHHAELSDKLNEQVANAKVYKLIAMRVKKSINKDGSIHKMYHVSNEELYKSFSIKLPPIVKLAPDDIWLIAFLADMGLIRYTIKNKDVSVEDMSSGERSMLHLYSSFATIPNIESGNLLVFYDEPENSLHPEWQQQFPLIFSRIVNEVYGIKNSHFIFATHSPLIIQNSKKNTKEKVFVLKFQKNRGLFESTVIEDIDAYCIESLMMDQFNVSYRTKDHKDRIEGYIKQRPYDDPIDSVMDAPKLKAEIFKLYSEISNDD